MLCLDFFIFFEIFKTFLKHTLSVIVDASLMRKEKRKYTEGSAGNEILQRWIAYIKIQAMSDGG